MGSLCSHRRTKRSYGKPDRIASALQIMLEGPIGGAAFNNEFGRPNLAGYFRTFEESVAGEMRGYHKPIMLAGGIGHIAASTFVQGGVFSRRAADSTGRTRNADRSRRWCGFQHGYRDEYAENLDFDSVQRGNAEMERRAQEVIDNCWQMERRGEPNPILSIHDVGAGGLSNALPELLHGSGRGRVFQFARYSLGRAGHVADADLEQRGAGALCACDQAGVAGIVPGDLRARTLPVRSSGHTRRHESS